jgi:hypothetical protein
VRRLAVLSAAAVLFAGCGIDTASERTYDDAFIRQIGAGSTTLAKAILTLESARFPAGLHEPKLQVPLMLLLEGRLAKLTQDDLVAIAEANLEIAHKYEGTVARLESTQSRLRAAKVKPGSYKNLSNGARHFVSVWDKYLAGLVTALGLDVYTLEKESPLVNELQTVLRDAYLSRDRPTASRFNTVRLHYLHALVRAGHKLEAVKVVMAKEANAGPLSDLVKHNSEAESIVKKVNELYPDGALAQQFKNRSA